MLALVQGAGGEYTAIFTPNATGGAEARRRGLSVRAGRPLPADRSTTTTRSTAFASSPAPQGRSVDYVPLTDARPAHRPRTARAALARRDRGAGQPLRVSGPVELLRREASARLVDAGARPRMARPARRRRVRADEPARSARSGRTSSTISFYKMFGYPTGVGCLLIRTRRDPASCVGRGSRAARSTSRACRAGSTFCRRARPASRTARSTTSAFRRSRSACGTSSGSAWTRSTRGALPDWLDARAAARPAHATAGPWSASTARRRRRCAAAR